MVHEDDPAPEFTAPVRLPNGDIEPLTLADATADGPAVFAFFPGAFTSVCTSEMETFRDRLDAIEAAGATLYGVSIDSPFSLDEFADQHDLGFPLIGDTERALVEAYDAAVDYEALGVRNLANRAVFVVDAEGTVTYRWVADNPGQEPDYDAVEAAAEAA